MSFVSTAWSTVGVNPVASMKESKSRRACICRVLSIP
jgi:hypothetical protein